MEKVRRYFAMAGAILGGTGAYYLRGPLETLLKKEFTPIVSVSFIVFTAAVFAVIFFFIGAPLSKGIVGSVDWLAKSLGGASLQDIAVSVGGLIVGLIIANLLTPSLARIPIVGAFLPAIAMVVLGYIGIAVAKSKKEDILSLSPGRLMQAVKGGRSALKPERKGDLPFTQATPKLLDTSTIIDGRIIDICRSGFIEGKLIIPSFVLDELRRIADSADNIKRNKGRRGLDTLNMLQRDFPTDVLTWDWPSNPGDDVDSLLLKMAKETGAEVITTDFNLAKIAELQEVGVLNVNRLANALKLMVAPGEELTVEIHREGKQPGQGVGYLDDGTMVVVEQAKKHLGEEITVVVTNVHTSPAGRMVFARPKYLDRAE
ncbi:MAG TPA: TRAM domain-containing protein [Firmicutes bacterium]|nr:TRAM domain-containing protein [Candidatus Fermentithermobacillaceae bacterium]